MIINFSYRKWLVIFSLIDRTLLKRGHMKIRAYKRRKRVFVAYYDTGSRNYLECPECHWRGEIDDIPSGATKEVSEISCPKCRLDLGMVSSPLDELNVAFPS